MYVNTRRVGPCQLKGFVGSSVPRVKMHRVEQKARSVRRSNALHSADCLSAKVHILHPAPWPQPKE